jgi:hypothetical protein
MRYLHALSASSALLIVALAVTGPAGAATQSADTGAPATETMPDYGALPDSVTTPDYETADGVATGSVQMAPAEKRKKQFDDCLAIWDRGTHMTKKEWRRTCKSSLEEVPEL